MEFDVLIVESVLHRRIIVVGIAPKNFFSGNYKKLVWKEEIYGHWEFIGCIDVAYALQYHLHFNEFWSVFAFAIVFGTFWCVLAVISVPGLFSIAVEQSYNFS